tara:strand:- start:707 stop:1438 length:732 start_codon:yes stop_codon:yes gene_type:complete
MKYSIILFILILTSCSNNVSIKKNKADPYSSSGFALIYNELDYNNKILSHKLNNFDLEIGHNKLKKNSIVKITNPDNNKSIELKITKKIKYPNFYKIVISKQVGQILELNKNMPFVSVEEKFKNKSFIAKKAVTFSEEKRVSNKAPVTMVKIDNISSQQQKEKKIIKKFSLIIGDFYSSESAENLRDTLEHKYVKKGSLRIEKLAKNKYRLFAGPYSSINTLKIRYFELNKYGFEDLDIKQND